MTQTKKQKKNLDNLAKELLGEEESKRLLIPLNLSAEEALKAVKAHLGIGKKSDN